MHLEGDARHTAEQMHDTIAKGEYLGALNTIKAYNQNWFEWLKFSQVDGTGIHVTPYTKVHDFLTTCETHIKLNIAPNCILLPHDTKREGALMLRELRKRDRTNIKLYSRGPGLELSDDLRASLQQHPRDCFFTKARSSKPYTHGDFQQFAPRNQISLASHAL